MKNRIVLICLSLGLLSCESSHVVTYRKQMKKAFIYDFKITYFRKLLLAGYNNTGGIKSAINEDQSGFGEPILSTDDHDLLDSIIKIDNDVMVKDSLGGRRRAEGAKGKRVLRYALNKYESKWLDSLAKARSKIFMKELKGQ